MVGGGEGMHVCTEKRLEHCPWWLVINQIQFLKDRPPCDNILTAVTLPVHAHSSAFVEHNSCSMCFSPRCPRLQSLSPSTAKGLWHLHPTQLYISRTVNNPAKMCTELKIGGYWWLFYGSLSLSCASHHSHCAPTQHNHLQSFLWFERHTANAHCLFSWHTDSNHL